MVPLISIFFRTQLQLINNGEITLVQLPCEVFKTIRKFVHIRIGLALLSLHELLDFDGWL